MEVGLTAGQKPVRRAAKAYLKSVAHFDPPEVSSIYGDLVQLILRHRFSGVRKVAWEANERP